MTEASAKQEKRRTPEDATDFEREQLRFLLSDGDIATMLVTINPSLAWLPLLSQMNLIKGETQLASWIERNFADVDAVRDVVANIRFFGPDTASILEYRLNLQIDHLPQLLARCWRLIIRHMKAAKRGVLQNEWYEIAPRIKRSEASTELLERIADSLRPKLVLNKRLSYRDTGDETPERPSDLMSIDYEVEDGLTADEVLSAWPESSSAETDDKLLSNLTAALRAALDDATEVGVEGNQGYSTSDSDVPSVAKHGQNEYRSGFYVIVRVMADLWERLAKKSPALSLRFVEEWGGSPFRLVRRLALFAGADAVVPAEVASNILLGLPQAELFVANSSVEVFRLVRARWKEFSEPKRESILHRFCAGPPREWFRVDGEVERAIDRYRFDILNEMKRENFELDAEAEAVLSDIRARWPKWQLRPADQAGFHVWVESGGAVVGDARKLQGVADGELVAAANKVSASADLMDGDDWHELCLSDPDRALRGLDAAATAGDWPRALWRQLLWARKEYAQPETRARIAHLLLKWPFETFGEIASSASSWLDEHAKSLDDTLLWLLWDRIADVSLTETAGADRE